MNPNMTLISEYWSQGLYFVVSFHLFFLFTCFPFFPFSVFPFLPVILFPCTWGSVLRSESCLMHLTGDVLLWYRGMDHEWGLKSFVCLVVVWYVHILLFIVPMGEFIFDTWWIMYSGQYVQVVLGIVCSLKLFYYRWDCSWCVRVAEKSAADLEKGRWLLQR